MALLGTREIWYDTNSVDNAPAGNTVLKAPAVTIATPQIRQSVTLEIAANTHENATVATAFNNLIGGAKTALDTYITDTLGLDDTGYNINYTARVTNVSRGLANTSIYLPAASDKMLVTVDVKISIAAV